ncbi:unnamed protein product, partial [Ectocarpus sp. 12 AP-2014]
RETKAHKVLRAVSRAQRGSDRGAVSVRRWRRNRLRKTKNRSNRCLGAAPVCSCRGLSVLIRKLPAINQSSVFPFRVEGDRGTKDTARLAPSAAAVMAR